jgi:ribosomal subunit interface protein
MVVKKPQGMKMMFKGMDSDKKAEAYIEKRLQKVNRIIKNVLEFEVEVSLDKKGKYRVELMVKTPYALYRAEEISESIEGSADIACEELTTQIVKDKSKMVDLKRRGARSLKKKIVLDEDARFKK